MIPVYEYDNKGKFIKTYNCKENYMFDKYEYISFEEAEGYFIDADENVAFEGTRVGRDKAKKTVVYHRYQKKLKQRYRVSPKAFCIFDMDGVKVAEFNSIKDCVNITNFSDEYIRQKLNNRSKITTQLKTEDGLYFILKSDLDQLDIVPFLSTIK
jgi:hypothetical protein